mgnify:CR=1 FL=1
MSSPERREIPRHEPIIPVAYFDDEGGPRLVVQFTGTDDYAIISPPRYDVAHASRGPVMLQSAIAKHGFLAFAEKQPQTTNIQEFVAAYTKKNPL